MNHSSSAITRDHSQEEMEEKSLTVAPFQCVWMNDFKFEEPGRGFVTFDACAPNDVTVVVRENVGTEHYHYKRDNAFNYTVIIGSHRNKRLKIEADGETVVDVECIGLCSSYFQSYWINVYDGLISVGTGRYPFQNIVIEWLDSNQNRSVQYVGLSSWDKHVGYKNVVVERNHMLMWKKVGSNDVGMKEDGKHQISEEPAETRSWGISDYLECWDFSDVKFIVGDEERIVPAHSVILQASGSFLCNSEMIHIRSTPYSILHSVLQFVYTGKTLISSSQIDLLLELSLRFKVMQLAKQCEEAREKLKLSGNHLKFTENVKLFCPISLSHCATTFPSGYPISAQSLKNFQSTEEFTDVEIFVEGHGYGNRAHKVILGLWSLPFAKMLTNGMNETLSSEVHLKDVSPEALKGMLDFMYSGQLEVNNNSAQFGSLLLELLILSDRFSITSLYQECCRTLLECLSEDTVCAILLAVSSLPSCTLIEQTCERIFATHFDFCTSGSLEFVFLEEETFARIIKHQDLTATSEEKILNAILMWCMKAEELLTWETIDKMEHFKDWLPLADNLLPFVRFPLLPLHVLKKMAKSYLCDVNSIFHDLVKEAIDFVEGEMADTLRGINVRFQYRRSSYKQLQYICDGDNNGVHYFAGTSFGQHQWVNPVLTKTIKITSSSPVSRYSDPKFLVSRTYQGTSFAGPKLEKDGSKSTWWMVDLGENRQLMCNYYTLRQDGSRTYVRSWNFQGSIDGTTWTNLRAHENDDKICKPGQFGSWPVPGPPALLPFRFFRVLLTGPTSDPANPFSFCICYLELYGFLR